MKRKKLHCESTRGRGRQEHIRPSPAPLSHHSDSARFGLARIPKNTPDRLAPPRATDPPSLPTRKGSSQPPNTLSLFRLRRGNMAANADISNSPFNGLARSTRSTHVIVDGVSIPLRGSALLPGQNAPVTYLLNQRVLAETDDLTCDTPGHAFMHTRTATITARTFTPPAIGTMLPIYSKCPCSATLPSPRQPTCSYTHWMLVQPTGLFSPTSGS